MFIEILSMILRFFFAKDFVGMRLLTVVPVIPVIRLTFQEQPSAFVLTLPDASKPQLPPRCVRLQWQWKRGHCINRIDSGPDLEGTFCSLSIWESNSLERVTLHCSWSCAYCIHEEASYLLIPLGKHPRGVWAESIKGIHWNLWQQFVYDFIYH